MNSDQFDASKRGLRNGCYIPKNNLESSPGSSSEEPVMVSAGSVPDISNES